MAKLNFKKIAANIFKMYQDCGSLQLVLDHPDIAPVKRDRVGVYRAMCAFMTSVPASHLPDFTHQAFRLKNIDERNSVVRILLEHVFSSHSQNTVLLNHIFQKCLYAPNTNPSILHSWIKQGHQLLAKEHWENSLGDNRVHCEDNMLRYLRACHARSVTLQDFLDFIPLFTFTEDTPNMIARKLLGEYSNHFFSENKNPYQFILNALEQLQSQHPENAMVTASLHQYFLMLPPKEQDRYQTQRNIQMRECLSDVVGQSHGQQRKRKL